MKIIKVFIIFLIFVGIMFPSIWILCLIVKFEAEINDMLTTTQRFFLDICYGFFLGYSLCINFYFFEKFSKWFNSKLK